VRNYVQSYQFVVAGSWNIAIVCRELTVLRAMHVGTLATGRIGLAVLKQLKPFDVYLHYTDWHRLLDDVEKELNLTYHDFRYRTWCPNMT